MKKRKRKRRKRWEILLDDLSEEYNEDFRKMTKEELLKWLAFLWEEINDLKDSYPDIY